MYYITPSSSAMQEDGISLVSVLTATSFYRRGQRHDYVSDYLPPSQSEFWKVYGPQR